MPEAIPVKPIAARPGRCPSGCCGIRISRNAPETDGTDQQLQQDPEHHRLARRHDQPEQGHENDRHAETGEPAHEGRAESHRRRAGEGQRPEAGKMQNRTQTPIRPDASDIIPETGKRPSLSLEVAVADDDARG
jgi:hypothetical protein